MATSLLVIGAGPAGMMAAGNAALYGANVTIIEKNKRVGRKLLITGKGRCNITNNCTPETFIKNIPTNPAFLYSAINQFTPEDTIGFFTNNNLEVKTERGNRVFPKSDKAMDVVDTMYSFVNRTGCKVCCDDIQSLIIENGMAKGVIGKDNKKYYADKVIIACGGKSYPLTGSTGAGYSFAKQAGHTIVSPKPSLVPLVSPNDFCRQLQGLALKNVSISVVEKQTGKNVYNDFGEMLFTHFGLSGPVILSASAHMHPMEPNRYKILIDLKPALSKEQLDKRILRDFDQFKNKDFLNSLNKLLPSSMVPIIVELSGIDPQIKCNSITKEQRLNLVELLKNFTVDITGFRPIEEAIITSGGVEVKEINPKTMQSKLAPNLFFAGEVIDVDAYTGGFNLQIAFSTGYVAGVSSAVDY